MHPNTQWAEEQSRSEDMEEPGKEDQGGTGLPTLSGRSQDWAAEGLVVKNLPANAREVRDSDQSLGRVGPLEKGMVTRTEEPGGLQSMGSQRFGHN